MDSKMVQEGVINVLMKPNDEPSTMDFDEKMREHLENVKLAQTEADKEALADKRNQDQEAKEAYAAKEAEDAQAAKLQADTAAQQQEQEAARKKAEMDARLAAAEKRQIDMSTDALYPWLRGTHQGQADA